MLVAAGLDYRQVFLALLVPAAVCILAVTIKGRFAHTADREPALEAARPTTTRR